MRYAYIAAWTVVLTLLVVVPGQAAERRLALVVGNNAYPNLAGDRQLRRAVNDARAMGEALQRLGFEVLRGENLGRQSLIDKLDELERRLEPGDIAFFFFAGHGVSIGGGNYILPTDVPDVQAGQETRLKGASLSENEIVLALQARGVRVAVVVLDACRDNPFRREGRRSVGQTRGLARTEAVSGVFSLYSAGIGQAALDRLGPTDTHPNSVFTRVLVPALGRPGLDLSALAVEVREEVVRLARTVNHDQRPAYYDETSGGRVYLAGLPPRPDPDATDARPDVVLWNAIRLSAVAAVFEEFIRKHPNSTHVAEARARLMALNKVEAPPQPGQLGLVLELPGRHDWINAAAFSPDGRRIVSASYEMLRLWDATSGAPIREFSEPPCRDYSVAFSPDGQRILSSCGDGSLRVWGTGSGALIREFKGDSIFRSAVAFSPDGQRILSGNADRIPRLWDLTSGAVIREFKGHSGAIRSVAVSSDGRRVLSGSADKTVRLWDATSGALIREFQGHCEAIRSVAFSPDGRRIVAGGDSNTMCLYDAVAGTLLREFKISGPKGETSVAISPDGRRVLSGGADHIVRLWDAASGELIREFKGHAGYIRSVGFSPDGRRIASGGDRTVRVWDLNDPSTPVTSAGPR